MAENDDQIKTEGSVSAEVLSFKDFLESVHPSVSKRISDLWHRESQVKRLNKVPIRLHCSVCDGERTFRSAFHQDFSKDTKVANPHLYYSCGDCHEYTKQFALHISLDPDPEGGSAYKYGEKPSFGIPVPSRVLRLFGRDRELFLKGRQCENQGLGVGAFAYYRRAVEKHRNDIIEEMVKVCETIGAPEALVRELEKAKAEISFTKSIEAIKTGLPDGLLIDGHNPLTALHNALSVGLHSETDEECLETAGAVRLVLTELIERMHLLRQNNKELNAAVRHLMSKKS